MAEMCLFDQAVSHAMRIAPVKRAEVLPVDGCLGRVLAESAMACTDVPPFDRSMMDGFAIVVDSVAEPGTVYDVMDTIAAGTSPSHSIAAHQAARIMTGAPLPAGADAVARLEWCDATETRQVKLLRAVRKGESVQRQGDDGCRGDLLLPAGTRLTPAHLALCRAFGTASLTVAEPLRCTLIITGSELLQNPALPLAPGQIYGTNDAYLRGTLASDGARVVNCLYIPDHRDEIRAAIAAAASDSDAILLTGGVSAGDFDYVPGVVTELADEVAVTRVMMRPGSPFVAARIGQTAIFAMSGNPAAGFVQFEALVRPALRKSVGWQDDPFPATAKLAHPLTLKPVKHTRILRATARIHQSEVLVDAEMAQSSGQISSFSRANCLIRIDDSHLPAQTVVPVRFLDGAFAQFISETWNPENP